MTTQPPHRGDYWSTVEQSEEWPPWKRRAFNALAFAISLAIIAVFVAAAWAIWLHPWVIPVVAAPLLGWAVISWITHA